MGGFIFRVKPPPTTNSRYLLRGTKFEFLVKTKKFLGGIAPMGVKPPGAGLKLKKIRYLLRGTKFKFLVKTTKFLGGVASISAFHLTI